MSHFLVINTGGTIGMVEGEKGLVPDGSSVQHAMRVRDELAAWRDHVLSWDDWQPLMDSSNLVPEHWYRIKSRIENTDDINGVLVIHGTDTLAYTASALSYLLSDLTLPVVVTGAMIPISVDTTDAIDNLNLSLMALLSNRTEVMVVVGKTILPGSRVTKISTKSHNAFSSNGWADEQWNTQPGPNKLSIRHPWRPRQVGVITLFPGAPIDALAHMINQQYAAIIINAYGNGNAPASDAVKTCLQKAQINQIPLFIRSQCFEGEVDFNLYSSGALFKEFKAVNCGRMVFEAVITKIQILCSESDDIDTIIKNFMTPYAREWQ